MQENTTKIAPIKARIFQYLDYKKIKKVDFYKKINLNASNFKTNSLKSELGSDKVAKILTSYPDINPNWLLTGIGEMIQNKEILTPKHNIEEPNKIIYTGPTGNKYTEMGNGKYKVSVPLVGARAYARYLSDFQDDEDLKERYDYVDFVVDMIGKGRYYAFEIKGDSMDDDSKRSIPDRSTVLARDVMQDHWKNKLNFKKYPFWIIVHQGSILCKEIIDHDAEKGIIKCHSINPSPEYADFEVHLSEVKQLLNIIKVQQDVNYY